MLRQGLLEQSAHAVLFQKHVQFAAQMVLMGSDAQYEALTGEHTLVVVLYMQLM